MTQINEKAFKAVEQTFPIFSPYEMRNLITAYLDALPSAPAERLEAGEWEVGMVERIRRILVEFKAENFNPLATAHMIASLTPSSKPVAEGKQALPEQTSEMVNERLLAALDEILNYSGGADNASQDEYVMERAQEAIAAAEQQKGKCDEDR